MIGSGDNHPGATTEPHMTQSFPTEFEFTITEADLLAYYRLYETVRADRDSSYLSAVHVPIAMCAAIMALAVAAGLTTSQFGAALALCLASYLLGLFAYQYEVYRSYGRRLARLVRDPAANRLRRIKVLADRIECTNGLVQTTFGYDALSDVAITGANVCLWLDRYYLITVPVQAFPSKEQAQAFCDALRSRMPPVA